MTGDGQGYKRKLIEVALPLEDINREAAREKSIRHGHPSTLHLWWARRPLAAARAVLFGQLVDDPSAHPDRFPTPEAQQAERERLFDIIRELVKWENSTNEKVLAAARAEIWRSCDGNPPPILDPFAGGGTIPLEAQRLGLEAHASDLNPVAVLINKALIEIPPKWAGRPPVFPGAAESRTTVEWTGTSGLAEDVRRYGQWMRDEAEKRIGHLYPKVKLPSTGAEATVIAWIWARTVRCPNPACGITMPLVRSWWLGKKKGKEAYVVPSVVDGRVQFSIGHDVTAAPTKENDGTVRRTGAVCIACRTAVPLSYVRAEGKAKRMGTQLMAIAAEGDRRREYVAPNPEHEAAADVPRPDDIPDTELPEQALGFRVQGYGMTHHADLFTNRQLTLLACLSYLVGEARDQLVSDLATAAIAEMDDANSYADAVLLYLGLTSSKAAAFHCAQARWRPDADKTAPGFGRQAISMVWDFAETNPWAGAGGDWIGLIDGTVRVVASSPGKPAGASSQLDAIRAQVGGRVVTTDPPYYDNVGYADLSDFFYVWLRACLGNVYPVLLKTVLTPKAGELVSDPYRHGTDARAFFEQGFEKVFRRIRGALSVAYPTAIYYAFKQSESKPDDAARVSTGWETLLESMVGSGWRITSTWPMRTESESRLRGHHSNALASSVVLACRPRRTDAPTTDRRGLIAELRAKLPDALRELQQGNIAPVDLAQAAIGPGMAVFSSYAQVTEQDGSPMRVKRALALINQVLAEVLSEQEGDFDVDTRWCVKWFEMRGFDDGPAGEADTLARAVNTSISGLERANVARVRAGKAVLIRPEELDDRYDPARDERPTVWEGTLHLSKRLEERGVTRAGEFMAKLGKRIDLDAVKELSYLLYSICEREKWAQTALRFNSLVTSWPDLLHTKDVVDRAESQDVQQTLPEEA